MIGDKWYRFEDHLVSAGVDEFDNSLGPARVEVNLRDFKVLKETPKGVQLQSWIQDRRFVLRDCRKRYACPTIAEALESFLARKRKQISILTRRADNARYAMELAQYVAREKGGRQ